MKMKATDLRIRWKEIVEDFTSRTLSNPSDALPALLGLAMTSEILETTTNICVEYG